MKTYLIQIHLDVLLKNPAIQECRSERDLTSPILVTGTFEHGEMDLSKESRDELQIYWEGQLTSCLYESEFTVIMEK